MGNYFAALLPSEHFNYSNKQAISNAHIIDFENKAAAFFQKKSAKLTINGRQAISFALSTLNLKLSDEVYITTTFNYPNISSCVTSTVFNFCKPSRVLSDNTKVIFIIHEFGVFHPETIQLIEYARQNGIVVIEDCAHTILSTQNNIKVGTLSDFTIVSLPKIFPVNWGGFIVGNDLLNTNNDIKDNISLLNDAYVAYTMWDSLEQINSDRKTIFNSYLDNINNPNIKPLITNCDNCFPWFFPLICSNNSIKVVEYLRANGIEAGIWHGSNVIVLPLHQNLTLDIIQRICTIVNAYN